MRVLAARASGACTPGLHISAQRVSARSPLRPGSLTAPTDGTVPAPILLMAGLGAAILAALGVGAMARQFGIPPDRGPALRWRHAWAEAAYRIDGCLAEITDRWRSGSGSDRRYP